MTDNRESELLAVVPDGLFIGGQWQQAEEGRTLKVYDPATGAVVKEIASASPADGMAALAAADAAFPAWSRTPARQRAELLRRAFDLLQERKEEFALLMTIEMGKPLAEARGEVAYGGEFVRWFSEEAAHVQGRYGANPEGTGRMIVSQHAVGPCFLITPWNGPLAMATRKIAPALAAGCTVVVKPAALTPLTTLYFAKLLEDAGVPAGVVNVIPTSTSGAVSEPIIRDPRLRKLSFTGSTSVGQPLGRRVRHDLAVPGALVELGQRLGERLAHLGGHQCGVLLAPLGQQLADRAQEVGPLALGTGGPAHVRRVGSGERGRHGRLVVGDVRRQLVPRGRVDGRDGGHQTDSRTRRRAAGTAGAVSPVSTTRFRIVPMCSMLISTTSPGWSGGGVSEPVRPHDSASEPDAQVPEASTSPALTHEARDACDTSCSKDQPMWPDRSAPTCSPFTLTAISRSRKPSASR
jgi:hypothetical protein